MADTIVACKLPHGLTIRLGEKVEVVNTPDPRDRHCVVTDPGVEVKLNGPSMVDPDGNRLAIGGYGFTRVDSDGFAAWLAANPNHPAVKNELIFAVENMNTAKGKARENATRKTGVERMEYDDPLGDGSIKPTKTLEQARSEARSQASG